MNYDLGLDLGIASVGWAVLNLDRQRIEDLGVRAFSAAEDPKTKASLAAPRREARSARRRLQRRADRLREIKHLFVKYDLAAQVDIDSALTTARDKPSPWELRGAGLDRLLTGEEFARVLFHIAKRRGFKSNRRTDRDDEKETGAVIASIEKNRARMADSGYRTVGEMTLRHPDFADRKCNLTGDYAHCVDRSSLAHEIDTLFAEQRRVGSARASKEFQNDYTTLFSRQLSFAAAGDVLAKVGSCTFEAGELRAPKNSYSAERFTLLTRINHLAWYTGGEKVSPTIEQRHLIATEAFKKCELKFSHLRKLLSLQEGDRFVGVAERVPDSEAVAKNERAKPFCNLAGYKEMRTLGEKAGVWIEIQNDFDILDDLAFALTFYKTEDDIRKYLANKKLPNSLVEAASGSKGFAKVIHLSTKALRKIIPHLEAGVVYSAACELAGYDHSNASESGNRSLKLPPIPIDEVRNPVVLRALSQARKVINAIIDRYGSPHQIHIEMAREVGKSPDDRKAIERQIDENRNANERRCEEFRELFHREPNGEDRLKLRLYREQQGKCAYSCREIDIQRLFETGYTEIDHIIPYSRSFDDSLSNKVLVHTAENRNKKNNTPFGYFGHDEAHWRTYETWVEATIRDTRKKQKLLSKAELSLEREGWLPRNLVDTKYIARFFSTYLRDNLQLSDENQKLPAVCVSGHITSLLRGVWGIAKVRESNDLHHAADAAVIAAISPGIINLMTRYRQERETMPRKSGEVFVDPETEEVIDFKYSFPLPWHGFRKEIEARLSDDPASQIAALALPRYADGKQVKPVLVSRKPDRKTSGSLHKETVKSKREDNEGNQIAVKRVNLVNLKAGDLNSLYAPETNQKLYAAIRERMAAHGNNAMKAFAEPLYKPANGGKQGPQVRRVKVWENQPSGFPVREGIADNGEMVRVDIFTKDGKFYLVPVYTKDFAAGVLPNKAIVADKLESDWITMDGSYGFYYTLYPYDLVRIIDSKGKCKVDNYEGRCTASCQNLDEKEKCKVGYFRSCHRGTGAFTLSKTNKNDDIKGLTGIGMRTAKSLQKYEVGVLGDCHLVAQEKRHGMADGGHQQPGEAED